MQHNVRAGGGIRHPLSCENHNALRLRMHSCLYNFPTIIINISSKQSVVPQRQPSIIHYWWLTIANYSPLFTIKLLYMVLVGPWTTAVWRTGASFTSFLKKTRRRWMTLCSTLGETATWHNNYLQSCHCCLCTARCLLTEQMFLCSFSPRRACSSFEVADQLLARSAQFIST